MTAYTIRALHQGRAASDPLVVPGPWDAASARVLADAGPHRRARHPERRDRRFARLGGRLDPPDAMFVAVTRIVRAVPVPVSADIQGGYGFAPGSWSGGAWRRAPSAAIWRTPRSAPRSRTLSGTRIGWWNEVPVSRW